MSKNNRIVELNRSHIRYKHNTINPRSGKRESGKTHHGKYEKAATTTTEIENELEESSNEILEDK